MQNFQNLKREWGWVDISPAQARATAQWGAVDVGAWSGIPYHARSTESNLQPRADAIDGAHVVARWERCDGGHGSDVMRVTRSAPFRAAALMRQHKTPAGRHFCGTLGCL
jgi:hypothetical protein